MHEACDRAREWAIADVDGELSTFEHVLLGAHLAECAACREFQASVSGFTGMLRSAPLETLERPIAISRIRRRVSVRLAPAVAAMAITVVGLGSILASSDLRTRSVRDTSGPGDRATAHLASVDMMNLSTATAIANATTATPPRVTARSSLRGGPVIRKR